MFRDCINADDLELYALGRTLPGPLLDDIEEHLLLCAVCRERLRAGDETVRLIRAALQAFV